jgi:hypothetical protein
LDGFVVQPPISTAAASMANHLIMNENPNRQVLEKLQTLVDRGSHILT